MIELHSVVPGELFAALERGATVITATRRLSSATRRWFEEEAQRRSHETWRTPDLLPWHQWIERQWEEAILADCVPAEARLLTQEQEYRVWEEIIAERLAEQPLQQLSGTVRQAADAWQLLKEWQLDLDAGAAHYNHDSAAFHSWQTAFETRCRRESWTPRALVGALLRQHFELPRMAVPAELLLLGFDELTPQQHALLAVLEERGCALQWIELAGRDGNAVRIQSVDPRRETENMARWVRARLEANPAAKIGVVVQDLASQRVVVMRALDHALSPHTLLPGELDGDRPYNISLGPPLARAPIVDTALALLRLLRPTAAISDVSRILRSPFLAGWTEEADARALLDVRLREPGEPVVSLRSVHFSATMEERTWHAPRLADRLGQWMEACRALPASAGPGVWADRFAELLQTIGWSAGRALSSEEYQTVEAWRDLLGTFAALQDVSASLRADEAVRLLRHLAVERTFQPRTGERPVQVLGMIEASGLQFDHLWILGLDDSAWPATPHPNPFIPLPLQRERGMPRSSETRELQVSRTMTRRLLRSADEVVVSSAARRGDEVLRPSPLVGGLPLVEFDSLVAGEGARWTDAIRASAKLEPVSADPGPPVAEARAEGGSALFKLQAACPFRAFAEIRLGARAIGETQVGLPATVRGSILHGVLERVWQRITRFEELQALDAAERERLVRECVAEAIDEYGIQYSHALRDRFRTLETERLTGHVLTWLELEMARAPFEVIAREAETTASAGGIRVRLRIDRIDRLADDRLLLIDYKVGRVSPKEWFGDRPDDPQLPLYSMAAPGRLAGLLFGQVRSGAIAFSGVAEEAQLAPGVPAFDAMKASKHFPSWEALLETWKETIGRLGEAFRAGEAAVDPKSPPRTCEYCPLGGLCRIHELTGWLGDSHEADAADADEEDVS